MKKGILIILASMVALSCATKKNSSNAPVNVNAPVANSEFFEKINQPLDFKELKINSKINLDTGSFIPTLNTTTYIENGKKIWMNISALFLNMGRGLATPDGVKGYEKWNKTYIDSNFDYLNHLLNINFLDYQALQNLILGKSFVPVNTADFQLTENAQGYLLTSKQNQKFINNGQESEYQTNLQYDKTGDLLQITLKEILKNESLDVMYSDWEQEENIRLPKNVKIIIKGSKSSQILMENTIFAFTSMETPYSVPSNYTKTDIK